MVAFLVAFRFEVDDVGVLPAGFAFAVAFCLRATRFFGVGSAGLDDVVAAALLDADLAAATRLAVAFLVAAFFAVGFLVAAFFAVGFLVAAFFAVGFLVAAFLVAAFLAVDGFDELDFFLAVAIAVTPPGRT